MTLNEASAAIIALMWEIAALVKAGLNATTTGAKNEALRQIADKLGIIVEKKE